MKHLSTLQTEFVKEARKWSERTLEEQREYLHKHPKSKRTLSAKPRELDFDSWIRSKNFMNLQTQERVPFEQLPVAQQEAIKKNFESEKAMPPEAPEVKEKKHKRKKYSVMGSPGEGDQIRAESPKDALIKYIMLHEGYDEKGAEKVVDAQWKDRDKIVLDDDQNETGFKLGNLEVKQVTKPKKPKKLTERRVKRMGRRIKRDLKRDNKYTDEVISETAKNFLNDHPEVKEFLKSQGVEEVNVIKTFVDYI